MAIPEMTDFKALTVQNESETNNAPMPTKDEVKGIIQDARKRNLEAISGNEDFQRKALTIDTRAVNAELDKADNEALSDEIENAYKRYELKKRKESLDYRIKMEKNLVKADVKAKVFQKKYEIAQRRYGYLYKSKIETRTQVDEEGNEVQVEVEVPCTDFTSNVFLNRLKELNHHYKNLSKETRKAIWTTLKTLLWIGIGAGVVFGIWELIQFVSKSGIV